jgi:hypothetical protein
MFFAAKSLAFKLVANPKIVGLAVAIVAAAFFIWKVYDAGRDANEKDVLRGTVNQLQKRAETDAEVQDLSDFDLCVRINGRVSDCADI